MPTFEEIRSCPQQFLDQRGFREAVLSLLANGGVGVFQNGYNPDIDTTTDPEDVQSTGAALYAGQPVHSAAAETIEIFSGSSDDSPASTGAHSVRVHGLDENWDVVTEDFTLDAADGTTPTVSTSLWRRVFYVEVLTAGAGGANAGALTVRNVTTTANIFAVIPAGDNRSKNAVYTVPSGNSLYLRRLYVYATDELTYSLLARSEGGVYVPLKTNTITELAPDETNFSGGIIIPEKTDLIIRVSITSADDNSVYAEFEGALVRD